MVIYNLFVEDRLIKAYSLPPGTYKVCAPVRKSNPERRRGTVYHYHLTCDKLSIKTYIKDVLDEDGGNGYWYMRFCTIEVYNNIYTNNRKTGNRWVKVLTERDFRMTLTLQ